MLLNIFMDSLLLTGILIVVFIFGILILVLKMYKKSVQGEALIRTGLGNTKVSFSGIFVFPVIHKMERMDITLKTVITQRMSKDGLICKDNIRADIKVTFFVRVNQTVEDVIKVAQSIGSERASNPKAIEALFDAKFSEALKTVGKHFDFEELYNSRAEFNKKIVETIGTDLNGYVLDDCAIDHLEQTPLRDLDENNILDAVGIKKIINITSEQKIQSNLIVKTQEKTITKQNVEARETVLELEKQLAEKEAKQDREIKTIRSREQAEIDKVKEEENQKSELARISAEEEIQVAEENKQRQIIVAKKNKERTDAIETERVEKDKLLEQTEKERIVSLAQIEKEKALEVEKKNIQDVIRDRIIVEKAVVEEEEKIKDTRAIAEADRNKKVSLTIASQAAEEDRIKKVMQAEVAKTTAEIAAKQKLIDADAELQTSTKTAEAIKIMAEAHAAEVASKGMGEAQVIEATAAAMAKQGISDASIIKVKGQADADVLELKGSSEAKVIEMKADAMIKQGQSEAGIIEAKGLADATVIERKASAIEKHGIAEAKVQDEKNLVEARGIEKKAEAMQKLDGVGREHEEFKLQLEKSKEIELAEISIKKDIAQAQAHVLSEAMKSAKIDIVGGETMFFDKIVGSITQGKSVDRMMDNSKTLTQIKDAFFDTSDGRTFKENLRGFIDKFGLGTEDIKNLSIANVLNTMAANATDSDSKASVNKLIQVTNVMGIADKAIGSLGLF